MSPRCAALALALVLVSAAPAHTQQAAAADPAAAAREDLQRLLPLARERELAREPGVRPAEERLELWKMVLLIDPDHIEARMGYDRAREDLESARSAEQSAEQAVAEESQRREERLRLAESALYLGNFGRAETLVEELLAAEPDNPRALALRASVRSARSARAGQLRWWILAAVLTVLALVLVVLWIRWWRRRAAAAAEKGSAAVATPSAARLKVTEGVGRGRMVPVDRDVFRIGAAQGDSEDRANHLVLSDARHLLSRYHCEVLRARGRYTLLDSSTNGTSINGRRLKPGGHRRLRHGDEIVLAGVSRLVFLDG